MHKDVGESWEGDLRGKGKGRRCACVPTYYCVTTEDQEPGIMTVENEEQRGVGIDESME